MINNISFTGVQNKLSQDITRVVKASSIFDTANKMNLEGVSTSVSKFLNTSFPSTSSKKLGILEGLDIDPLRSYKASHGLDVFI